jgi:1-pyrroline-5-carboxylate dehydrogenase
MRDKMFNILDGLQIDSPMNFKTFTSTVIDERSFDKIKSYIDYGKEKNSGLELIYGGKCDKSIGYYVYPTIFVTQDPFNKLIREVFLKYKIYVRIFIIKKKI